MMVNWEGCRNSRDLGGLPASGGTRIRFGALIRSDSHSRLTDGGIAAVRAAGISRILDLRWPRETVHDPSPFAGDPAYRNEPLITEPAEEGTTMPDAYRAMLDGNRRRIAGVVIQMADAPPGPLAVHCSAGRDRTGVLVALALGVAGVPYASIAADYALTEGCTGGTILRTLAHLDHRHGGVRGYLRKGGVSDARLRMLRDRLVASGRGGSSAVAGSSEAAADATRHAAL